MLILFFVPKLIKKAFTLVELMIVVVIVGILASMAAVNHRTQKTRAEYLSALSTVRAISGAVKNYVYSDRAVQSTSSTAQTESVYGIDIVESVFSGFTVIPAGLSFRIQAFYNADRDPTTDAETTVFVWRPDGVVDSCSGNTNNCGMAS